MLRANQKGMKKKGKGRKMTQRPKLQKLPRQRIQSSAKKGEQNYVSKEGASDTSIRKTDKHGHIIKHIDLSRNKTMDKPKTLVKKEKLSDGEANNTEIKTEPQDIALAVEESPVRDRTRPSSVIKVTFVEDNELRFKNSLITDLPSVHQLAYTGSGSPQFDDFKFGKRARMRLRLLTLLKKYRDRQKCKQILLSRTQAGPGGTGKQEQEQTSRNHV